MREGLVGGRHFVGVFAFFNHVALIFEGIENFHGERALHGDAFASAAVIHNPAQGQTGLARGGDFHRDLIRCV